MQTLGPSTVPGDFNGISKDGHDPGPASTEPGPHLEKRQHGLVVRRIVGTDGRRDGFHDHVMVGRAEQARRIIAEGAVAIGGADVRPAA